MSEPAMSASDPASLERGYRRLLAWYPKWFRQENKEEILAVLMACAQDGQTRPSLEAALDLFKGAARMRLRPMPGQPRTVFLAIWLMIASVVTEIADLITLRVTEGGIKAGLIARYPAYAHALVHAVNVQVAIDEISGPIGIAVTLWLAWTIVKGRQRGRVAFAVWFGISCLSVLLSLSQDALIYAPAAMGVGFATWALYATAIMLVFSKASGPYFQRRDLVLI
jgi:hypothetical protein